MVEPGNMRDSNSDKCKKSLTPNTVNRKRQINVLTESRHSKRKNTSDTRSDCKEIINEIIIA